MGQTKTNLTKGKRNLNFYFRQRQIFFRNDWCRINGSLCEPSQSCNICTSHLRSDGNWSFFHCMVFRLWAGAVAPSDVIVPCQNTGLGPEKTSFFQALSIQTKIARGTIEIVSDVHLLKPGDKVGMSEATLLNMLKISPFSYGLKCVQCFEEGSLFDPSILDVTDEDIRAKFMDGVNRVAAASLNIGYPTMVSAPHSIANGLKKLLAVAAATDISFAAAEKMKAYLADPSAFAVAAPAAAESAAPAAKEEEPEEEESDESMGFDLFG